jgi:hypothetical protein
MTAEFWQLEETLKVKNHSSFSNFGKVFFHDGLVTQTGIGVVDDVANQMLKKCMTW